jgi:hypothetical protein
MSRERRAFFISASVFEAYREWKSYWGLTRPYDESGTKLVQDLPYRGLQWSARWGLARIEGEAQFIPAQGGCVLYLALRGASLASRLLLAPWLPFSGQLWRTVEKFQVSDAVRGFHLPALDAGGS